MANDLLPLSKEEMTERGWDACDIILITADAYVDHPSFGAAMIGRVLENAGYRVGIIAQPDCRSVEDFRQLGRPRLFFAITAGNIDSMVANYTANKKPRSGDDYSPGGIKGARPDRACIVYANKARQAFPGSAIVLGGLEASLRRLAHHDYWSETVRRSVLLDAKADMLIYGMGERQVLEIARRVKSGEDIRAIDDVRGTAVIRQSIVRAPDCIEIPPFETVSRDPDAFNRAFRTAYAECDPFTGRTVAQRHGDRYVVQLPPALPLSTDEIDRLYALPYARSWHPAYDRKGGVPGLESVRFSVTSHRGCAGECSFCSLYAHQGRIVQSRSEKSILREISLLAASPAFRGTVTDIGGPTANLYGAGCERWVAGGTCRTKKCLMPSRCANLKLGYTAAVALWNKALAIPGVKHIFIGSGLRYDLLADKASDEYLRALCARHISGRLKVAPEHCAPGVMRLMNKPRFDIYERFEDRFRHANAKVGRKQFLVNYFISAHPGATLTDALDLAVRLAGKRIHPEQVQDFLPLPMTVSGAMYHTGRDPFTGEKVHIPKGRERTLQRALIQYADQGNKKYVIEALRALKRTDLLPVFYPARPRKAPR